MYDFSNLRTSSRSNSTCLVRRFVYFVGKIGWYGIINILKTSSFYFPLGFNNFHIYCQQEMDYLLDDDALDVAPSMISDDEEEDPSHHTIKATWYTADLG